MAQAPVQPRVLSIQSHVVHGYVGGPPFTVGLQLAARRASVTHQRTNTEVLSFVQATSARCFPYSCLALTWTRCGCLTHCGACPEAALAKSLFHLACPEAALAKSLFHLAKSTLPFTYVESAPQPVPLAPARQGTRDYSCYCMLPGKRPNLPGVARCWRSLHC